MATTEFSSHIMYHNITKNLRDKRGDTMIESTNPLGVCFGMMKVKYQAYDSVLTDLDYLRPTDKINVFINLETVLKYMSMTQDLEKKIMTCADIDKILVSDIINLAAHYKDFFRGNGLDTNIFLYMTDLDSTTMDFQETKYIEDFRSYYLNKYMGNPKFALLGSKLKDVILPEVRTICDYIPGVYLITKKGVDSGVIPALIAEKYPDRKNIIISGDVHDTQYGYMDNFLSQLYIRGYNTHILASNVSGYLKTITRNNDIPQPIIDIFKNPSFYKLLLCCMGDRYRSIIGISGIKLMKLVNIINQALNDNKITMDVTSAMLLSDIFPDSIKGEIFHNMIAVDVHNKLTLLGDGIKKDVTAQIIDKVDTISLMKLNAEVFVKCPLRLEGLLR